MLQQPELRYSSFRKFEGKRKLEKQPRGGEELAGKEKEEEDGGRIYVCQI